MSVCDHEQPNSPMTPFHSITGASSSLLVWKYHITLHHFLYWLQLVLLLRVTIPLWRKRRFPKESLSCSARMRQKLLYQNVKHIPSYDEHSSSGNLPTSLTVQNPRFKIHLLHLIQHFIQRGEISVKYLSCQLSQLFDFVTTTVSNNNNKIAI